MIIPSAASRRTPSSPSRRSITPECKTAKTQTLEYTFYIDTTGPNSKKPTFSYKTEDWGWGPESMYTISVESNEAWYQDYDMSITIEYDEETGDFYASAFTSTYFPTAAAERRGRPRYERIRQHDVHRLAYRYFPRI